MNNLWNEIKRLYSNGEIVTRLIIVNVAVFVIVNIVHVLLFLFSPNIDAVAAIMDEVLGWLAVPSAVGDLATRPWTVFTYMFLHKEFFHVLFNMLWLYWFGRIFLMYIDQKKLLGVYLLGGLSGAGLYMLAYNIFPAFAEYVSYSIMLGASASVMAVVIAISFYVPDYSINLLFVGPVKLKYIAVLTIVLDFLMIASSNAGGHISHLGGALFGYVFIMQYKKQKDITKWVWGMFYPQKSSTNRKKYKNPHMHVSYKKPKTDMEYNKQKVEERELLDGILDKIARSGYESLSAKEKEILFKMSSKR
ncbi:MAG: rhomboid family intramembrane serine protease [Salinivirgaceae bacterium]|jgi:membrane associated rhomboid family serine protease|nr:rhomboid family intramembrane serine protease [Salinivirgaceae bacterium]